MFTAEMAKAAVEEYEKKCQEKYEKAIAEFVYDTEICIEAAAKKGQHTCVKGKSGCPFDANAEDRVKKMLESGGYAVKNCGAYLIIQW